jgi:hypothetical protein
MGRFRRFINDMELHEIPLLGRKYTWSSEREAPTLVRLDRVFVTMEWEHTYPDCILQSSESMIYDHCPLLLGCMSPLKASAGVILFESFWPRLEGFMEEVERSWSQPLEGSCTLQCFTDKLQRLSRDLQSWLGISSNNYSSLQRSYINSK